MRIGSGRASRVWVDHSQYHVLAGPEWEVGEETIPGLFLDLGPQAVAVLTGLYMGKIPVRARALTSAPGEPEDGWDVIGETDLACPDGNIAVLDPNGSVYRQFGELASAGPGRYRMRVHIRNREQAEEQKPSTEGHHLLFWPVTEPEPPRLLTQMDAYGRIISGEDVVRHHRSTMSSGRRFRSLIGEQTAMNQSTSALVGAKVGAIMHSRQATSGDVHRT